MKHRAPLFALLAALVLAAGWWFGLYAPKAEEQAALETETAELVAQAQQLSMRVEQLEEIKANSFEYETKLARLDEYLPQDPHQPAFLKAVQSAADLSGVQITDLTQGDPTPVVDAPPSIDPGRVLVEIPVTMTLEGGYFQLVDLMRRLETDVTRAVLVDNVSFAEGEAGYPELTGSWQGRVFAVMPVQAPAPDAPDDGATPDGVTPEDGVAPEGTPGEGTESDAESGDAGSTTDADQAGSQTAQATGEEETS